MDPATIAAAGGLAGLLRDYGPWGLLALSLFANAYLYKAERACSAAQIALVEKVAQALAAATAAAAAAALAYDRLTANLEVRGKAVDDLSRQIETSGTEVRHGIANLSFALNALSKVVERYFDRGRGPS